MRTIKQWGSLLRGILFLLTACQKEAPITVEPTSVPRVLLNGSPLLLEKVAPVEKGDLVMIPAEQVMEALGYRCTWNEQDLSMVCINTQNTIVFTLGQSQAILNKEPIYMLSSPMYSGSDLLIEAHFLKELSNLLVEWDRESHSLQLYDYDRLDYGMYFYDTELNGWDDWDVIGCQKLVEGESNPFFDPNKPTVIWIHGWQNGGVSTKSRPDFHLYRNGVDEFTHNEWKQQGWNVAIFHWEQLADELLPNDAEAKINSSTNNSVGMRWKTADANYASAFESQVDTPVAELFAQAYALLARQTNNQKIRVVGSSFGGQVALHGTERIEQQGVAPLPERIALLDMAWTRNYVNNQGLFTTEITTRAITTLAPLIPIEYYRTSLLTTFFTPRALVEKAAFQEMVFDYASTFGIELKHTVITYHYFWSLQFDPPNALDPNGQSAGVGLSAATDNTVLRQMMGQQFHWQHTQGKQTFTPQDDLFEKQTGSGY